jgi:hypothetical protein
VGDGDGRRPPEEIAADRARSEDLDRRLLEMIERYKRLIEERRASEGT